MINREEANEVLFELINSGILNAVLEDSVQEIATCINYEEKGLHLWGADDDCTELMVAKRQDLWTPEEIAKCEAISKKYKFTPRKL